MRWRRMGAPSLGGGPSRQVSCSQLLWLPSPPRPFTRSGTTWSQQAYLKASNTNAFDAFGTVVSVSGDGATVAVGAPAEDSNATGVGGN